MSRVEFISYTGEYPCLCHGVLTLRINGKEVQFDDIHSGGHVYFDEQWNAYVVRGPWMVGIPLEYAEYKNEINQCMNDNVPKGCCGGCI